MQIQINQEHINMCPLTLLDEISPIDLALRECINPKYWARVIGNEIEIFSTDNKIVAEVKLPHEAVVFDKRHAQGKSVYPINFKLNLDEQFVY